MRIGYLVPEFPGQTHVFFWREVIALRKLGVDLKLISTSRPKTLSRHSFAAEAQAETHYIFPPSWVASIVYLLSRPRLFFRMLRYLALVKGTTVYQRLRLGGLILCAADLLLMAQREAITHVHGHSCASAAHLLALANQLKDLPYSLTLHGDLHVYGAGNEAKFAQAKFIACVTFALQKQVFEQCSIDWPRLPVIRMGVDVDRFKPDFQKKSTEQLLTLITVARLAECKGHIYAIRALRQAKDQGLKARYIIVGEGEHRSAIEQEIQSLKMQEEVQLVGTKNELEVLEYLQQADIFVLPSAGYGEAAPVSVMEAMACQLPVIATIIGGTPEMIQSQVNGILVKQEDVDHMAESFLLLGRNPSLRLSLAAEARKTAETQFSAEHFALELYRAIANKGPS